MTPVRVVQTFYQRFGAGDIQGALALLHDEVSWEIPSKARVPYFGSYNGPGGVKQFFERLLRVENVVEFQPQLFATDGNTVVVVGHERCSAKQTGREFFVEWAQIFTVDNGKIRAWKEIIDTAPMVEAYASGN